jgi:hypothetical protein
MSYLWRIGSTWKNYYRNSIEYLLVLFNTAVRLLEKYTTPRHEEMKKEERKMKKARMLRDVPNLTASVFFNP